MTDNLMVFTSGSKAKTRKAPSYPNIEDMLAKAPISQAFYDHVPGAYEKFKNGTTYHCGKKSLDTKTRSKANATLIKGLARKQQGLV